MKFFIIFSLLFNIVSGNAYSQSCVDSSSRFLLQSNNLKLAVRDNLVLSDSSVVVLGYHNNNNATEDFLFITRLDKHNNVIFTKKIQGFEGYARNIIECNNGDLLVVASNSTELSQIAWLFRLSNNGNLIWQRKIEKGHALSSYGSGGSFEINETSGGFIYLGMTDQIETDVAEDIFSAYYYIYKLNSAGNIIWEKTLIQNNSWNNLINGIKEENGSVIFVTQQYNTNIGQACNATNFKSINFFQLNSNDGAFKNSTSFCLNIISDPCGGIIDSYRNSVSFLSNGNIIIAGNISLCDNSSQLLTMEFDANFNPVRCFKYNYVSPFHISTGIVNTDKFGQISIVSRGYYTNQIYYATLLANGQIIRQRKIDLLPGAVLSFGNARPAFKKPNDFLMFTNLTDNGVEALQIMEFKGDNNQTSDCTGEDTTYITGQAHSIYSMPYSWDTIRSERQSLITTNYIFSDFSFQRVEICSSISICDSLKISGADSVCLNNPVHNFIATRNPGCNKVPLWKIDPSAIITKQSFNDTTIQLQFKTPWEGYLYAYSNSCGNLLDSFYIKVFDLTPPINLGRDTTFCSPVILHAGNNFVYYQWQDNSVNQSFTVTQPGVYHVTATDRCGNLYKDSITFYPRRNSVSLGADTCISTYPVMLTAGAGFKKYQWQNGTGNQEFSANTPGIYYVTAHNFCDEVFTDTIRLYKAIQAFSLGKDSFLCPGNIIQLKAPLGYDQYRWQDGSTGTNFAARQENKYYVTVTDFCGKEYSDTINIILVNKKLDFGADLTICKRESIQLSVPGNFASYTWLPDYKISSTVAKKVTVSPEISTFYNVTAVTAEGCIAKDTIQVLVEQCPQHFFMPTGFTPDNNGKNDFFKPSVTAPMEKYELSIYNRWGQRIFHSTNILNGWDGKLSGVNQHAGVFIWVCNYKFYDQPPAFQKGTLMLIR